MIAPIGNLIESDPRFPSGDWHGFFIQNSICRGRRFPMSLNLSFLRGNMTGEGSDWVGKFIIKGTYELKIGKTCFHKRYLKAHDIYYEGFASRPGICGVWSLLRDIDRGGFVIWPKGWPDPTQQTTRERIDVPQRLIPVIVPSHSSSLLDR